MPGSLRALPPARTRPSSSETGTSPASVGKACWEPSPTSTAKSRARFAGRTFKDLASLDEVLIDLDGTENKSRLGANAIVGVSMAAARAISVIEDVPLWRTFTGPEAVPRLPVPHFNVVNGGVHASNQLDFQEFMLAPLGAPSEAEAVRAGAEVYGALKRRLSANGLSTGLGDEGGFAPEIASPEEVLSLLVASVEDAGYEPGRKGVALAMDPASSEFYQDGKYHVAGEVLSSDEMIERYAEMVESYPVWLLEDGLAESDWDGWERLTVRLGERIELVGDDILCTNPAIITEAIARKVGNASLIKLNQIGTVTETLEAMRICRKAGWGQFVSHRSGETEDSFHRRPGGGHRLRPYEDGRAGPRRASRQVQPAHRDRGRRAPALRPRIGADLGRRRLRRQHCS